MNYFLATFAFMGLFPMQIETTYEEAKQACLQEIRDWRSFSGNRQVIDSANGGAREIRTYCKAHEYRYGRGQFMGYLEWIETDMNTGSPSVQKMYIHFGKTFKF